MRWTLHSVRSRRRLQALCDHWTPSAPATACTCTPSTHTTHTCTPCTHMLYTLHTHKTHIHPAHTLYTLHTDNTHVHPAHTCTPCTTCVHPTRTPHTCAPYTHNTQCTLQCTELCCWFGIKPVNKHFSSSKRFPTKVFRNPAQTMAITKNRLAEQQQQSVKQQQVGWSLTSFSEQIWLYQRRVKQQHAVCVWIGIALAYKCTYHYRQRNAPVFKLLRCRFWGFSHRRGDTLHVPSSMPLVQWLGYRTPKTEIFTGIWSKCGI